MQFKKPGFEKGERNNSKQLSLIKTENAKISSRRIKQIKGIN